MLWRVPEPGHPSDNPTLRRQGLKVPSQVRDLFLPVSISAFAGFMISGFMGSITPSYMGEVLGYEGRHLVIGCVAGLVFLASCAGQIGEDRLPERAVLPLGMALLTMGIGIVTAGFVVQTLWLLIAGIALAGVGHGIAFKGGLSALGREAPEDETADVTATYFTVAYVAISIPVLTVGALQTMLPLPPIATGYAAASTLLAALAFIMIRRRQ
jgi:MFS family permease